LARCSKHPWTCLQCGTRHFRKTRGIGHKGFEENIRRSAALFRARRFRSVHTAVTEVAHLAAAPRTLLQELHIAQRIEQVHAKALA